MIAALVLAAGQGARMGAPKPLVQWRGRSLLAHVLTYLRDGGVSRAWVVEGAWPLPDTELGGATRVVHRGWAEGPFTSLQAGLAAIAVHDPAAVIVATVDRPHVRASTVVALLQAFARAPQCVWQPAFGGRRGHPVLLPSAAIASVLAASPQASLREVLAAPQLPRDVVLVDDAAVVDNVDTPEQLAALASPEHQR
ncbi:MAG: NTP transferase domain-containing protein [Nannocystaceae bacterium]|nr:NTP transferase domain-containing protein [Nannocystaceae bacterium]